MSYHCLGCSFMVKVFGEMKSYDSFEDTNFSCLSSCYALGFSLSFIVFMKRLWKRRVE